MRINSRFLLLTSLLLIGLAPLFQSSPSFTSTFQSSAKLIDSNGNQLNDAAKSILNQGVLALTGLEHLSRNNSSSNSNTDINEKHSPSSLHFKQNKATFFSSLIYRAQTDSFLNSDRKRKLFPFHTFA